MAPLFQHIITLIARMMIGLYFIVTGALSIADWNGKAGNIAAKLGFLEGTIGEAGTTATSHTLLAIAIGVALIGGLSVVIGLRARVGAVLLIIFLAPATIIMHNFWAVSAGQMQGEVLIFLKNVALLGGVLMVLAFGPGGLSADLILPRRRQMGQF